MGDVKSKETEERLPAAARIYLDIWRMGIGPDGKALRVKAAAQLAGVTVSAVKGWRERIPGFRELERRARAGSVPGYGQRLARLIVEGLVVPAGRRMAAELGGEDGEWRPAWEVLRATGGLAMVVEIGEREKLSDLLQELRGDGENGEEEMEDLDDLEGLEVADGSG